MNKRILDFTDPLIYVNWVQEYTDALYDDSIRYIFLKGGAGAGKSIVASQLTLQEVLEKKEYAWIRKIRATIKNSCYQSLYNQAKDWELLDDLDFQKSLLCEAKENDGKILFLGLDDAEKVKSIAALDRIVCEEASDLSFDDFTQLDIRLRGRKNQKLIALFNPISDQHWLKTQIKDNKDWDWSKTIWIEKTVLDNKFADQQYIESLKRLEKTNPEAYKIYFLNQWGQAKRGLIFDNYKVTDRVFEPDFYGLDFGFNDPCVLSASKIIDEYEQEKKTLLLEEILYESGLTEASLIHRLEKLKIPKNKKIYADGSRPEMIEAIKKAGWNIEAAKKGAGSVYFGIMKLKEFNIELINSKNGVKEFQNYCWLEKGSTLLDEPKGGFDHFIDSSRYSISYLTTETKQENTYTPIYF